MAQRLCGDFLGAVCDGEADGAKVIRMVKCGQDILLILKSRGIKHGISSIAHNERKGWTNVRRLLAWRAVPMRSPAKVAWFRQAALLRVARRSDLYRHGGL
jgi:hypothetical protein